MRKKKTKKIGCMDVHLIFFNTKSMCANPTSDDRIIYNCLYELRIYLIPKCINK